IPHRLAEHVGMSGLAIAIALVLAVPVGLYIGHTGRGRLVGVSIANLGRAIPSFAILSLVFVIVANAGLGLGFIPTLVALVALAIPPILTNTYVAVESVDPDTIEACRGMGMTERQVLFAVEVPLGAPLMIAGIRTAAVQVVATATLAALVAWGGLGRYIIDGFATQDIPQVFGGGVLVALLALLTEVFFAALQRVARGRKGRARPAATPSLERASEVF
ncbi:MAG TPA: ABC transporter permease, partial [Actinomycetota bacterium]|nr:ABC transporter permease [Actinomycetota bacterium]